MNKDNTSSNRRRDIVTPAQRKAAENQRLLAQKKADEQKMLSGQQASAEQLRMQQQKRAQQEQLRRSSVKSPAERVTRNNIPTNASYKGNPTVASRNPGNISHSQTHNISTAPPAQSAPKNQGLTKEQQQQRLQKQRELELLKERVRAEEAERAAEEACHRKIRELRYNIDRQRLMREELIAKDMKKDSPENIKIRSIIAVSVIAVLIVLNIVALSGLTKKDIPAKNTAPVSDTVLDNADKESTVSDSLENIGIPIQQTDKHTVSSSDYVNGTLVLINSEHAYDFNNTGTDITDDELIVVAANIPDKSYKASNYKTLLNRETVENLNLMMADFYAYCKRDDVMVNTAHRTYEQQLEIFEAKKAQLGEDQKIAQIPGCSEHHSGYSFDFSIYPKNENGSTFINIGEYAWIYENCHKYGFILRYPEGKTAITGIDPESWHFRYVGVPHATYMYSKGKTLEEYITDISIYSESIPLTINISDTESYSVFYVKKSDEGKVTFSVPKDTEYEISGDNAGGFIVWYNNADVGNKGKITPIPENTSDSTENEVSEQTRNYEESSLPIPEAVDER